MRSGPYTHRHLHRPTALEWLTVLAAMLACLCVAVVVMVGALVIAGPWGPWVVLVAGAAAWRGIR